MPPDATEPTDADYKTIASELKAGAVVPFLGAGASADCNLPTGSALAELLIEAGKRDSHEFPDSSGRSDLARIASWFDEKGGRPWLWRTLRQAFEVNSAPGPLHESLARLPKLRLIVTTSYDDLIESAMLQRWEEDGRKEGRKPWTVVDRGDRDAVWVRQPGETWKKSLSKYLGKTITD